jgi:N-glycosylase/DNA lyase
MKRKQYAGVDQLHNDFACRKREIRRRLSDFGSVKPEEYFYELAYCLLTPQSSAMNAGKAVEKLRAAGFHKHHVEPAGLLRQKDSYVRFHNTKGKHLQEAKRRFPEILAALSDGRSSEELRAWLVKSVRGLGWKEASHFLRNIGHRNLAILDRHILKNLQGHSIIPSLPKTMSAKRYLAIEEKFREFSGSVGIAMDELDLLFWSRETGKILK